MAVGPNGIKAQLSKLIVRVIIGAIKKRILFDLLGKIISLKINLIPSANGCSNPQIPTTFGPKRR